MSERINFFIRFIILTMVVISSSAYASTICSFNCPGSGSGDTAGPLTQIFEISSADGDLLLSTSGLVILDQNLFNNLSGLTINPLTVVYMGLAELPETLVLPELMQLNGIIYTGNAAFTGLEGDILLRHFSHSAVLDLSASNGILVMNTDLLFSVPVPVPGAIWLLLSGLFSLFYFGFKRQ